MNYDKEFIQFHNKEVIKLKKEFIKRVEEDYDEPYDNQDLYDKYYGRLQKRSNEIKELNNKHRYDSSTSLIGTCQEYLRSKNYKFDRLKNIITKDCYELYQKDSKYSQFESFIHFLEIFAEYLVINMLQSLMSKNMKDFFKHIDNKNMKDFFLINYTNDLNILEVAKNQKSKSVNNVIYVQNILEAKEKLILLHLVINFREGSYSKMGIGIKNDIPNPEFYRLLIICSDILVEENINTISTNNNNYNYFRKGIEHSEKDFIGKREILKNIILKIEEYDNISNIVKLLKNFTTKYKSII